MLSILAPTNRILSVLVLLFALLAFSLLIPATSDARVGSCTGDPKVTLTNGKTIVVTESIATDAANVTKITYTFHLPPSVYVTQIIQSDTGIAAKEVYNFVNDSPANTYTTDLVVNVTGSAVAVSDKMAIGTSSKTASGMTGQHLVTTLVVK